MYSGELEVQAKRKAIVGKQTMGQLTEQFLEGTYSKYKVPLAGPSCIYSSDYGNCSLNTQETCSLESSELYYMGYPTMGSPPFYAPEQPTLTPP